jgi:thiol:disulfide interchange protein DsbD
MMTMRFWIVLAWAALGLLRSQALQPQTEVHLLLSRDSAKAGEVIPAALQMKMHAGWHTYWRNGGDAGMPTTAEWHLPAGFTATGFQWPVPEKLVISKLIAYVYDGEILLPFEIKIPTDAKAGPVSIQGDISWLECSDTTCVPQEGKVTAQVTIGEQSIPSSAAGLITKWMEKIPRRDESLNVTARWEGAAKGTSRSLLIEWKPEIAPAQPDFFGYEADDFNVEAKTEVLEASPQIARLRKNVLLLGKKWPETISGLILPKSGEKHPEAREVVLKVAEAGAPAVRAGNAATAAAPIELGGGGGAKSIWVLLGLAFVGGLILNIMPCVLPVIALKILGFVNQSREAPRRVRELGLLYGLGVLASFLVLAGVIIGVKRSGGDVAWGMQMQNPIFVMAMLMVVALVTMNLFGVFEVILPGSALGTATQLASREGRGGAFYNGILATLLATPCTAPALAFAVGSAITQPNYVIVLTFTAIALGLAFPYVALSWNPRWMKFLPKPGAWMEKFKMAMGFPMLATTVWLMYIASYHFGPASILWIGLFLVILAAAAWVWGQFVQRGRTRQTVAIIFVLALLALDYFWVLEGKLHWRRTPTGSEGQWAQIDNKPGGIQWEKWSPEAVEQARSAGRPVLVDFTAVWCLTCQVNKESIEIDSVRKKLKEMNVLPLVADYSGRSPMITRELKRYDRAGVPLVVLFPADAQAAPILLPEILTPSIVLNALELAGGKPAARQAILQASREVSARD